MSAWAIGIDTGGTFTDVAALEAGTGRVVITKVPSVPADPSRAVMHGLLKLAEQISPFELGDVRFFAHGTTVATNALLEMKGARAGLVITEGFNAVYELRGGTRPSGSDLIDLFFQKPTLLVPQRHTRYVRERVRADGSVATPLDEASVREAARYYREQRVAAVAVCLLFSFMNPRHEQRVAEIFKEEYPECRVSLSSVVLPVIREYQRLSTTVLDAYVGPVVQTYLLALNDNLNRHGLTSPQKYVMQSNGGLMRIEAGSNYPNQTLLSGPAAGVVFGASVGEQVNQRNVVTFDMGGTSTDISVLSAGSYHETREGRVSGQDIATPMIEIRTLGAGGSTQAWIGPDGLLKVGPQSAGADPGPACYGRGGTIPTVTDANMVLGYLRPEAFIGGQMKIDVELSRRAITDHIAKPLGLTLEQAALGIHRVVNVTMEVGLRLSLVERGLDPRQFALVSFGGAGPVHAAKLATDVGIKQVVAPAYPGISCAMGLLQTDVKHYYIQSRLAPIAQFPVGEMETILWGLEQRARDEAALEQLDLSALRLHRQIDLRYPYQGYELTVPAPDGAVTADTLTGIRREFDRLHQQMYGVSAPSEVPEVVNLRVVSVIPVPHLSLPQLEPGGPSASAAQTGARPVLFEGAAGFRDTPVYQRSLLRAHNRIQGPAIVEQMDSTVVVPPGQLAWVDHHGNIIIETGGQVPS
jgi:N-methylhydantoinase A